MENEDTISWSALEYEQKERGNDWFWALGIVIIAGAATAFIYGNYFFALFLLVGGSILWFFAIRKPSIVEYEMNEKGLKVKDRVFPYKNMKSFWISHDAPVPILFIKIERAFMPVLSLPLDQDVSDTVRYILHEKNIPEEEMHPHLSEKIMDALGF